MSNVIIFLKLFSKFDVGVHNNNGSTCCSVDII